MNTLKRETVRGVPFRDFGLLEAQYGKVYRLRDTHAVRGLRRVLQTLCSVARPRAVSYAAAESSGQ